MTFTNRAALVSVSFAASNLVWSAYRLNLLSHTCRRTLCVAIVERLSLRHSSFQSDLSSAAERGRTLLCVHLKDIVSVCLSEENKKALAHISGNEPISRNQLRIQTSRLHAYIPPSGVSKRSEKVLLLFDALNAWAFLSNAMILLALLCRYNQKHPDAKNTMQTNIVQMNIVGPFFPNVSLTL